MWYLKIWGNDPKIPTRLLGIYLKTCKHSSLSHGFPIVFPMKIPMFFRLGTSRSAPKDRTVRMLRSASVDTALASAMDTRMDMLICLGRGRPGRPVIPGRPVKRHAYHDDNVIYLKSVCLSVRPSVCLSVCVCVIYHTSCIYIYMYIYITYNLSCIIYHISCITHHIS